MTTYNGNGPNAGFITGNGSSGSVDITPPGYDPDVHCGLKMTGFHLVENLGNDNFDDEPDFDGTIAFTADGSNVTFTISGLGPSDNSRQFMIIPVYEYDTIGPGGCGDPMIKTFDGKSYRL